MTYHEFPYGGSFEVFEVTPGSELASEYEEGWYWWPCSPGCLPDSEVAIGPFPTYDSAKEDANNDC